MNVKVTCPSCGRVTELDPAKIPPKPVTFGCPGCKTKVPVDGAALHRGELGGAAKPAPSSPPAAAAPPPVAVATMDTGGHDAGDEFDLIQHLEIPAGVSLPSGLLICDDAQAAAELRRVLGPYSSELKACSNAREARAIASVNLPELVVCVGKAVTAPPFKPLEPLFSLEPGERRRTFFVVVADNVKTMDGNAAFFHGVDLFVARKDLGRIDRVLYSALEYRRALCGTFLDGMVAVEGA